MPEYIPAGPWDENPDLWDRVSLGGREFSGLAMVDIDRANKWQTKPAKGSHGAERSFSGVDLAKVRIEYRVWTSEQYAELTGDLLPLIEPDPTKGKRDAVAISHAVALARKVGQITIDSVAGPKRVEAGMWAIYIDATEHRPPESKNATGTAKGGTGKAKTPCELLHEQYQDNRRKAAAKRKEAAAKLAVADLGGWLDALRDADVLDLLLRPIELQMQSLGCLVFAPSGNGGTNP